MSKVVILVNADLKHSGKLISASPVTERMIRAFEKAILADFPEIEINIVTPAMVRYHNFPQEDGILVCPLTIDLPERLPFDQHQLFQACRDIDARRAWVLENTTHKTGGHSFLGDHWLPIIYNPQGSLCGAVIGEGVMPNSYHQPTNLGKEEQKALSQLGFQLLESIAASPGVYLMQFGYSSNKEILFDRLWPFPAAPAIASLVPQQTDLFACHWRCLIHQPVTDIVNASGLVSS
ncbi:hypothetical protein NIES208_03170 [[Limnothrix rosea] IAM M-220]|nr:hypothetical protein NIES208_03170 [[Limnothrix rosea] IAM M-220]